MKVVVFLWTLIVVNIVHADVNSSENYDDAWKDFIERYNKTYSHESEAQYRKEIFKNNSEIIKDHNEKNHSFMLQMNQFGDLTIEEFRRYHLLKLKADRYTDHSKGCENSFSFENLNRVIIPETVDLRNNGCVRNEVLNQGTYNKSSWAFSVVGALEAQLHRLNYSHKLCEQYLIECGKIMKDNEYKNISTIKEAIQYLNDNGIFTEKLYSYVKEFVKDKYLQNYSYCCSQEDIPKSLRFAPLRYTPIDTPIDVTKKTLYSKGPLSAYVDASRSTFQFYHNGTYNDPCEYNLTSNTDGYQAVLIVGYGKDHWLLKNSWGTSWGEGGYMNLDFKNCSIEKHAWEMDVTVKLIM